MAEFINYVHDNTKTIYKNRYYMNNYTDNSDKNSAYDPDNYLKILYHLYNKKYIEGNDMYAHAAGSKKYTDTWLFLSMHFLCALRNTDLVRIPHPRLTLAPKISWSRWKAEHFQRQMQEPPYIQYCMNLRLSDLPHTKRRVQAVLLQLNCISRRALKRI